ncbi:MAG: cellulase family glycosylhydrolase [Deltaproteobacteria bacterium]|nr:cellulase family glycosylhydrolase [Deltaproteobacteria bacterium]
MPWQSTIYYRLATRPHLSYVALMWQRTLNKSKGFWPEQYILISGCLFLSSIGIGANMQYWESQRRGANFFNEVETAERFQSAKQNRIEIVRLVFNKWKANRPQFKMGDFLFGSLDEFTTIVPDDLERLKSTLDTANRAGIKVVLSTLSLPGARWRQQNGNQLDLRLWKNDSFHRSAAHFWKELARNLKNHPAIVGYNVVNEPYPEFASPRFLDWYSDDYEKWYQKIKGTASDMNAFYKLVTSAIREEDRDTPIVLDSGFFATPWAFKYLTPVADSKVLYSFHMYEPYAFTSHQNEGKFRYPGKAPIGEADEAPLVHWDAKMLSQFLDPVRDWQKKWTMPSDRIFVSEFGLCRRNEGGAQYLKDLIAVFQKENWHWAFYSFREDTWTGMDYELGQDPLPPEYFEALELGKDIRQKFYKKNPLFDAIRAGLGEDKLGL